MRFLATRLGSTSLAALSFCFLIAVVSVYASTPASNDVTAPTVAGQSVTVTWTGSVVPGSAGAAGSCPAAVSDGHVINLTIPAGAYDNVNLRAVFRIEWDETPPGSGVPDLALQVLEGTTSRGFSDGGSPSESITLENPANGSFNARACSFASATPTAIRGSFTITASSKDPDADSDGDGVKDPADLCPSTPPGTTVDATGCPPPASCAAGAGAAAAASTPLSGPVRIDAPVLAEWDRFGPYKTYGAFVHFYRQGTREQQDIVLTTLGLKKLHDFRRYTTAVFAEGPVAAFRKLAEHPWVMRIEHNTPMRYLGDTQNWATRANMAREVVSGGPYFDATGARLTGKGVTLGIIDGGLLGAHPDFAGRLNHNFKFAGATYADVGYTDSENNGGGHGTHVTGTVGGGGQMSDGGYPMASAAPLVPGTYTGASPQAKLIHWGHGAAIVVLNAAFAYQHILDNLTTPGFANLRAVNNSYGAAGGGAYDPNSASSQLIRRIVGCGVNMVFAASNDGGDGSEDLTSPTCKDPTPGVICVASYNDQGSGRLDGPLSSFSSRGKQGNPDKYPDIAAPGDLITSTCLQGTPTQAICTGGDSDAAETDWQPWYGTISGTSMATPNVTGMIGLLAQADPSLTPAEIELLLQRTARKVGGGYEPDPQHPGSTIHFGYGAGLVDIQAALEDLIAKGRPITKAGPLATDLEWTVFDGDVDVDASEGAAEAIKLTMQNFNRDGLPGILYRLTLADAEDFLSPALSYRVVQNVRGLHTETTILATAAGVTIAEPGETNSAVATFVERAGNVVSFFVPYSQMGFPPINEPIHNIRVIVENEAGAVDYAPSPTDAPVASAAVQPMFGRAFTTRLAPGTVPPSTERACELPGLTRVTSPSGLTGNGSSTGHDDLRRIWVAEPGDMPGKLVITMKVENLTPTPIANYRWYVYFNTPSRTDVEAQFVAMDTVPPGGSSAAPGFARGFRETIETPAAGVGSFTIEGNLPGSSWNANGTITLVLDKTQFGLQTGDVVSSIAGSIRQTSNPSNGSGLTVDSAAAIEGYTLVGNLPCPTVTAGPQAVLLASINKGPAPLVVDFDASGSTTPAVGGSITSFTFDFGDGTAPVTQGTPTVQHTYAAVGSYTATLTVKDSTNTISTNAAVQIITVTGVEDAGNNRLGGALPALSLLMVGLLALARSRRNRTRS